ncbi:MAG TPA: NUDIX hydrolase [Sphingobium sp.]|jgi:nudix-type nucleoside diphosphatase (YffH/AdpP family)|uniref:NUDIX domain-containing protein n=1 Tax=unclassified Sphingobium TaxID=2611147 RepID=UPI0007F386F2|nr:MULTISPECIES: NUDIX hydrolase [unclassified Sphingobium]OAN57031.1 ADP-ribose pyrophosphatase [Sphingobium sp. TCM1]WIW87102.1 NUDIX hydrolase [Sphingobium sp. V4]HAF42894.1 NUDIX hydrolase [Sphingobium sp.]
MTKILSTRLIYEDWLNLRMAHVRAESGDEFERHVVEMRPAIAVLPYDPERRVALTVSMPRAPVTLAGLPDMMEAIAGLIDEEAERCARREAMEEAGVRLGDLVHVGQIWSIPSVVTERIDYFLAAYRAQDRIETGGGLPDEQENITVHEPSLDTLWTMMVRRELTDGKLAILLMALRLRRPDLFSVPVD